MGTWKDSFEVHSAPVGLVPAEPDTLVLDNVLKSAVPTFDKVTEEGMRLSCLQSPDKTARHQLSVGPTDAKMTTCDEFHVFSASTLDEQAKACVGRSSPDAQGFSAPHVVDQQPKN